MDSNWLYAENRQTKGKAGEEPADRRFKERIVGAKGGYGENRTRCSKCNCRIHLSDAAARWSKQSPEIPVTCYHCSKDEPPKERRPIWFQKLPEIIANIDALERRQQFDRESIALLFDLQTSAAVKLMDELGAEKIGGSYWISRKNLLMRLHRMAKTKSYKIAVAQETERRRKLSDTIRQAKDEQKLRKVQIPIAPASRWKNFQELDGTTMEPGRITVTFKDPEEALVRLMEIGYAVADDYEGFERLVGVQVSEVAT